jgi:hypothetical protein
VTCGGAPAYVWPGGGITMMVDVICMPENARSAMCRRRRWWRRSNSPCGVDDYEALGGHMKHVMPLAEARAGKKAIQNDHILAGQKGVPRKQGVPWPTDERHFGWSKPGSKRGGRRMSIQAAMLPDGKRLHLQHGPIDLIIAADGKAAEVRRTYMAARARFDTVLTRLAGELPLLRTQMTNKGCRSKGRLRGAWHRRCSPSGASR